MVVKCIILLIITVNNKNTFDYSRFSTIIYQRNFDSLNVKRIGNWPFGPSDALYCDTIRNLVFLGAGGGIHILNVSDPNNIIEMCEPIKTYGKVQNFFYDHLAQRLYIANSAAGFEIWTVENPNLPMKIGAFDGYHEVCGVFVSGDYAYLACGADGFCILDISIPAYPQEVGHCSTPDSALDVCVSGNFAYVADADMFYIGGGLVVIDISTQTNPQIVGYSTPSNPREVGFYHIDSTAYLIAMAVMIRDTIAYVGYCQAGLRIVNIADPSTPVEIGFYDTPNFASDVYVYGTCVYVADGRTGLRIIDISIPTNPSEIGYFDGVDYSMDICIFNDLAFLTFGSDGLRIFNISDPASPQLISRCDTPGYAEGIAISASYAYIADWNGFCIVNISDPCNPYLESYINLNGYASGVDLIDSFVCVASFFSGLYVINVANPSNPYVVGHCNSPFTANDVDIVGSYAYVSAGYEGLYTVDISVPSNPHVVGSCNTTAFKSQTINNLLCAAGQDSGLRIVNISNPLLPYEIGHYHTPWALGVYTLGSMTYIADSHLGLRIININNPQAPYEVGFYELPGFVSSSAFVVGQVIYLSCYLCGLQVFESSVPYISELQSKNAVSENTIVQNPVYGNTLSISLPSGINAEISLSIYNCVGRRVYSSVILPCRNSAYLNVPIGYLTSGVYFLCISTKSNTKILKFVVIH